MRGKSGSKGGSKAGGRHGHASRGKRDGQQVSLRSVRHPIAAKFTAAHQIQGKRNDAVRQKRAKHAPSTNAELDPDNPLFSKLLAKHTADVRARARAREMELEREFSELEDAAAAAAAAAAAVAILRLGSSGDTGDAANDGVIDRSRSGTGTSTQGSKFSFSGISSVTSVSSKSDAMSLTSSPSATPASLSGSSKRTSDTSSSFDSSDDDTSIDDDDSDAGVSTDVVIDVNERGSRGRRGSAKRRRQMSFSSFSTLPSSFSSGSSSGSSNGSIVMQGRTMSGVDRVVSLFGSDVSDIDERSSATFSGSSATSPIASIDDSWGGIHAIGGGFVGGGGGGGGWKEKLHSGDFMSVSALATDEKSVSEVSGMSDMSVGSRDELDAFVNGFVNRGGGAAHNQSADDGSGAVQLDDALMKLVKASS
jgi:hypothetical protein